MLHSSHVFTEGNRIGFVHFYLSLLIFSILNQSCQILVILKIIVYGYLIVLSHNKLLLNCSQGLGSSIFHISEGKVKRYQQQQCQRGSCAFFFFFLSKHPIANLLFLYLFLHSLCLFKLGPTVLQPLCHTESLLLV